MKEFVYDIVKDPKTFQQNRLRAHSDHVAFKSLAEVQTGNSSYRISLDGVWHFHYSKNVADAPANFYEASFDTSSWDRIRVPAHIQMEGYDKPQYVNVQYPWDGREMLTPPETISHFENL